MSNKITKIPLAKSFGNSKPRPSGQTGWSPTYTPPPKDAPKSGLG